jgi:Peptidase family M1 domain
VKAVALGLLASLALTPCLSGAPREYPDVHAFILKLQTALQSRDFETYLEAFSPDLRTAQRDSLDLFFRRLKMETIALHLANKGRLDPKTPRAFVRAVYQNSYSAIVETWQLGLAPGPDGWQIKDKTVCGNVSPLYKISIPAGPPERVAAVEIQHVDIRLAFRNALVFYDNVPGLDTALLIIGDGSVVFSPSDPAESHQLSLIYKAPRLQDSIAYAYIRCSPAFFARNVAIQKKPGSSPAPATEAETALAGSLFQKLGARYFTIQTPLSAEPLSFVPQGDEAAFEFQGRKTGEMSYVYSPFADEEVVLINRTRGRFINFYSPATEKDTRRMFVSFGQKCRVEHYEIEVAFQPQDFRLSARARIRVQANVDSLNAVSLKFNPELEILKVYDSEQRELFFTQDKGGRLLYIYFLEPVDARRTTTFDVFYRGRLMPPPQANDVVTAGQQSETVVLSGPRYETYFYSQSACWYPAPPSEDFFTARLKLIVPPGYTSIANGRLLEEGTLNGIPRVTELDTTGSVYTVYEIDTPVKYLSFLVGRLSLTEELAGRLPLSCYVASDVRWLRRNFLDDAQKILAFYQELFGPFPFENLRIVQRLWSSAGGHSPASFLVVNELPRRSDAMGQIVPLVPSPNSPVDLSHWKDYFLAHEIAHQWWGQGVTGATYRDQWLSEGLSQFAAALYLRSKYGEDAFAAILKKFSKWTGKKSGWGAITLGSRLSYVDFEAYQAIVYDKAALVLNMLRDMMGEERFFAGLRDFFGRYHQGAASTGQFRAAMEAAAGRGLADFFDPWLNSHELAEVRVNRRLERSGDTTVLRVRVAQSGRVFVFPLWISWKGADGTARREKVLVGQKAQEFEIRTSGEVREVTVNPERAVPGRFLSGKD